MTEEPVDNKEDIPLDVQLATLVNENAELKKANKELVTYLFSLSGANDEIGRNLIKSGNMLFTFSDQLRTVLNKRKQEPNVNKE
jgi:hypothetical protein